MTPTADEVIKTTLLLVDDNDVFRCTLAEAIKRRGWRVETASNPTDALEQAEAISPSHALVDLNLDGASGLDLIPRLIELDPRIRIVVLTGYASIATAVATIRLGATHYLAKPSEVDEILAAFDKTSGDVAHSIPDEPLSVPQLEWEHIQRTLLAHHGNISAAARALNLHRRSLQRKLRKHDPW